MWLMCLTSSLSHSLDLVQQIKLYLVDHSLRSDKLS
jgi:hypothetical protein